MGAAVSKAKSKVTVNTTRSSFSTGKGKSKVKDRKEDNWSSLTVGVFTLSHSGGVVAPGESFTIDVECYVPTQDIFCEEIVVKIMEYAWIKRKGASIKLKAISYLPYINFENLDNIFQEALTRGLTGDDLLLNKQDIGEPKIIFDEETNELHFSDGCVGAQEVMHIHLHLYNSGLVPCEATAAIITTNDPAAFYVNPEKFTIMSHSDLTVSLTFRPTKIGVFREVLQVMVILPSPLEPQIFKAKLIGEAHLPRILVTAPPYPHTLMFPPTLVGEFSEETIAFANNGKINCTVIVEILTEKNIVMLFYPETNSLSQVKGNIHKVRLKKGEEYRILVRFYPDSAREVMSQVRLLVTNNPYEDQMITVKGVGYMQDIVIDGLPLANSQNRNLERLSEIHELSLKYALNIPPCSVGEFAKKVFLLKNQTQDAWYRFEWEGMEFINISPSVGHLPPNSCTEILVEFMSDLPKIVIENEEIVCSLTQIQLNSPSVVAWNNRQKTVVWCESTEESDSTTRMKKKLCEREEPEFEELPGSSQSLFVAVTACVDYPQISCPNEDILFPPTIISQIEEHKLILQNTAMVPAQFAWFIRNQIQGQVDESVKASYGSVTLSSERPKLELRPKMKEKVLRPATCPNVRPGAIPASVTLLPQDDLFLRESSPNIGLDLTSWPIFVEPDQGNIPPGEHTICSVKFKPLQMAKYSCNLQLRLENAEPDKSSIVVKVEGSSMLPCCHLVVPDSTPCSDPESLQIKFRSIGIKKPINKRVKVLNTTYEEYTFYWREINQDQCSSFGCSKPISIVSPTKHVEVMFSFMPRETGHYKSTWLLSIPDRQIQQKVTLVGDAFQPCVTLSSTFLQLRSTLVGVRSQGKVALENHEDCDLKFSVDANSLHCGSWGQTVQVQPMRGVIPAQAQIDLSVSLSPTQAGKGEFMVQVAVQTLDSHLKLVVTAQCFLVQPQLIYQDFNKLLHQMQSDRNNFIDIGVVEVRIPVTLIFSLTNIGKPVFHYNCVWSPEEAHKSQLSVSVTNKAGIVGPQSKQTISVVLTPLARTVFSGVRLELIITKGPTYVMFFNGTAAQPHFRFSVDKYDFGACFVQSSDTNCNEMDLIFSNIDENPLLIEGEFDPKPHLKVGLTQTVVNPRSELHIPITFVPLDCCTYEETLSFLVDGSFHHEVVVLGRGVDLNVMLVNPVDKLVDLEGVVVGRIKRRIIEVINSSEVTVNASFTLEPPVSEINLGPETVTLSPHQVTKLIITFTPNTVVKGIQQELVLNFESVRKVLSVVKASSVGISVKLDRDYLPFGSTPIGNSPTAKLLLSNDGDLVVKFSWKVSDSVFTISPSEGYIAPSTDVALIVKYSPVKLQPIVHAKGVCTLANGEELLVTLSGSCVELPPPSMTIPLSCPVRETAITQIPIFNKFGLEIKLSASITGEYFSGDSVAMIPPYGTHMFDITYMPLSMTTPSQLHKGTAVFFFVDGSCLVYSLEGSATEPLVSDKLVFELFTHTSHNALIPVHNWMQTPQKFRVTCELLSPHKMSHPGYQLTCNHYFMVSGSQTRDLNMNFISLLPGSFKFKVVLTNELSGDYKWYEVTFEVSPCPPMGEINLQAQVRQEKHHSLMFHNPLNHPVTVNVHVDVPGLTAVNTPLLVQPLEQEEIMLKYLPLWPCEQSTSNLELTCSDMGVFPYTVTTSALPAQPSNPLHITCDLGQSATTSLTLVNPTGWQATFQCVSSLKDVTVEPQVILDPNQSKIIQVSYQPSSLCDITGEIVVTSAEAGEFIFPVIGICNYPEPSGPYTLTPGSFNTVPFKNVFEDDQTFIVSIDNPAFAVKETNIIVRSSEGAKKKAVSFKNVFKDDQTFIVSIDNPAFAVKETDITVKSSEVVDIKVEMVEIEAKEFPRYPITGKMSVFPKDESLSHIKWVFYLHGELVQRVQIIDETISSTVT